MFGQRQAELAQLAQLGFRLGEGRSSLLGLRLPFACIKAKYGLARLQLIAFLYEDLLDPAADLGGEFDPFRGTHAAADHHGLTHGLCRREQDLDGRRPQEQGCARCGNSGQGEGEQQRPASPPGQSGGQGGVQRRLHQRFLLLSLHMGKQGKCAGQSRADRKACEGGGGDSAPAFARCWVGRWRML